MQSEAHPRGRASPAEHAPRIGAGHEFLAQLTQAVDLEREEEHLLCKLGVSLEQLEHVAHGHQDCDCTDDLCQHRWNCVVLVLYATPNFIVNTVNENKYFVYVD